MNFRASLHKPHSDAMTVLRKRHLRRLSHLGCMHHPLGWSFEGEEALSQGLSHFLKQKCCLSPALEQCLPA